MSESKALPSVVDLVSPESKLVTSPNHHGRQNHGTAVASTPRDIIVLSDGEDTATFPQPTRKRKRQRRGLPKDDGFGSGIGHTVIDLLNDDPTGINVRATADDDAPAATVPKAKATTSVKVSPELQVLEVFPDADLTGVRNLLGQCDHKIDIVLALMSEHGYQKASAKATPVYPQPQNGGISIRAKPQTQKWSYDFMAVDSFIPTDLYVKQAKSQLLYDFWFLTAVGVDAILQRYGNHYAKAHGAIVDALKGTGDEETKFHRVNNVLQGSPPLSEQCQRLNDYHKKKSGVVTKRKSLLKRWEPQVSDPILREEIMYVQGKFQQFLEVGRKHDTMEIKKQKAIASKTAVECSCCYDGYDIDDMVACSQEGHLFCIDCLKRFAESQIFGVGNLGIDPRTKKPAHELKCFHGECSSGFDRLSLRKALPEATLQKYDEMQFNISLQAAGLANLVKCPKCEFQVELPYDQKFLVCPVESCKYASCRECGEPSHIGIR
jgi:TRIAD3 protein (E3 ubiquitin-protein ligase RNF216)